MLGLVVSLLVVAGVCAGLSWFAREPMEAAGKALVGSFGSWGILLGVVLAELSPVPLAGEPFLLLGHHGGLSFPWLAFLGCTGNLVAAGLCYPCGVLLRRLGLVDRVLGERRAAAESAVRRRGAWALVLASFTPLPFGTLAWVAGALGMPLRAYALACLTRVPKVLIYLVVMTLAGD